MKAFAPWVSSVAREMPSPHLESEVNRRFLPVAVAITASTALLLTGCSSGGGDDDSSDKIKGAGGGGKDTSASASPSVKPGGAKRPEIELPKSFQVEFAGWTNSDPKLQAIMDDGKEELRAGYAAIIDADLSSKAVAFYDVGDALKSSREWIKPYVDDDVTLIGKVRVFDPQVHVSNEGFGVLFYCVEEGKASTKDRKTGKVTGTPKGTNSRLQYRMRLDKTEQDVWKTTTAETERGAC
ncbi:hypothetical protein [Streptomyces sp. NPDC058672]|uniref:hypothetical protein n=1 Tax=Streptomyces sp. NPDC058672 TaxID=3346591 RepID=UPI003648EFAC